VTPEQETALVRFVLNAEKAKDEVFVGIDPGADGAIGLLCGKRAVAVDIPTIKVKRAGGNKTVFNYSEIVRLFSHLKRVRDRVHVCLEQAQIQVGGKGANAYTAFRVGVAYGIWPLFLAVKGYATEETYPQAWKRKMGLRGTDKEASRHKAIGLFPTADLRLKKHHNRAEALLIAEFHRRNH
jgi:crossover junction endodeoxyribonuclease RuvC